MLAEVAGVLADELHADLRLAHAHAVGVEDAAVAVENPLGPGKAVALEGGERVQLRHGRVVVQVAPVEFQQSAQEHGLGVALQEWRPQEVQQRFAEVLGVVPEPLVPIQCHADDVGLVMHHAQFEIGGEAALREVGRRHQGRPRSHWRPGVVQFADDVGFAVQEAPDVAPHRNVFGLEEAGDALKNGSPGDRKRREVPFAAQRRHRLLEAVGDGFPWRAGQCFRRGADQKPGGLRTLRGYPGKRVQPFQADVACRHAERYCVVLGKPRQGLLVAAVVNVVYQFVGDSKRYGMGRFHFTSFVVCGWRLVLLYWLLWGCRRQRKARIGAHFWSFSEFVLVQPHDEIRYVAAPCRYL